jgi:hypothetical protein
MGIGRAERYLTRLRLGAIRNTGEQSTEEKSSIEISTDPYPSFDFGNQCPDDFHKNTLKSQKKPKAGPLLQPSPKRPGKRIEEEETEEKEVGLGTKDPEEEGSNFLLRGQEASAMISYFTSIGNAFLEYLYKDNGGADAGSLKNIEYSLDFKEIISVLSKDSFVSKAHWVTNNEVLIDFRCIGVPMGEVGNQSIDVILRVKNKEITKIYVCESQVSALEQAGDQGDVLVVGTVDGSLLLFNGSESEFQHRNSTNLVQKHLNSTWGSHKATADLPALRFSSYSSDFSFESHSSAVVAVISDGKQVFSLEEMGVLTAWTCTNLPLDVYISGSFVKLTKNYSLKVSSGDHIGSIERSFFSLAIKAASDP